MVEIYIALVSGSINSTGGRGRRGARKEEGKIQEKWVNRSKIKRSQAQRLMHICYICYIVYIHYYTHIHTYIHTSAPMYICVI